mgnify:FL=1
MKKAQLSGSLRANVGKKDAAALRRDGMVPCVLYGQGEQTHFSVRSIDVQKLIFSPDVFQIEIEVEGKTKLAIIKDLQMHPVKDTPLHVDFLELDAKKPVSLALPLRTTGSALGVMNGGKLRTPYRKLKVSGLPGDLPEAIVVDITKLRIGHSVRVSSLEVPGVEFLDPANAVILSVKMARGAVNDADEVEEEDGEAEAASEDAAE